jgi:hypothetical protein
MLSRSIHRYRFEDLLMRVHGRVRSERAICEPIQGAALAGRLRQIKLVVGPTLTLKECPLIVVCSRTHATFVILSGKYAAN